jgi:uncharacterized protein YkwD
MLSELVLVGAMLASAEHAVFDEVNAHRREIGLPALIWNEAAAAEARRHCRNVLRGSARSPHAGFAQRAARLRQATGATRAAENILLAGGNGFRVGRAVAEWLASPDHRSSMEGPYEMSGVGLAQQGGATCAAQIFLGR